MTRVRYDDQTLTMEVYGHAGYGPSGSDIVCAAVSILTQTLLQNLINYKDHGWYTLEYDMNTPGEIYIHCKENGHYSMVHEMMKFTMVGFEMLEREFPKHIKILEEGQK